MESIAALLALVVVVLALIWRQRQDTNRLLDELHAQRTNDTANATLEAVRLTAEGIRAALYPPGNNITVVEPPPETNAPAGIDMNTDWSDAYLPDADLTELFNHEERGPS